MILLALSVTLLALAVFYHAHKNHWTMMELHYRQAVSQRNLQKEHQEHEVEFAKMQADIFSGRQSNVVKFPDKN